MKYESKELGEFEVESNEIVISDPCYEKDEWCNLIKKALNGSWKAKIIVGDFNDMGKRTNDLFVCHKDYDYLDIDNYAWKHIGDCGVDSGQLGVFDLKYFKDDKDKSLDDIEESEICQDEKFYNRMCFLTLGNDSGNNTYGGVYKRGVNVSSGFGDGNYIVRAIIENKIVVAVWVNFIGSDEYDDEVEEC